MRPGAPDWPLLDAFFYPAPALLVNWPLHQLSLPIAAAVFMGAGSGLLAWRLSENGFWRLWVLGTPSFVMAVALGQWSPLIVLGAVLPGAAFLLACKPTIGLACFVYNPSWRAMFGVVAITMISIALLPGWPADWLANLRFVEQHPSPIFTPFGWLLGLALLRWRQPEARLLLAMALVPQLMFFADQLPLGLVGRTRREIVGQAICGVAAFTAWWAMVAPGDLYVQEAQPFVLAGLFMPALVVVLLRPNEGVAPNWLESLIANGRLTFSRRV